MNIPQTSEHSLPPETSMNADDEPRYTPTEIAQRLGKSGNAGRKFVLEEIRRGRLGCYDLTRKCKMVSERQYQEYLESKRKRTTGE
jgi:hypothetical protein